MRAEVTLTAGRTYRLEGIRFDFGKPKVIEDEAIIEWVMATKGFTIRFLDGPQGSTPSPVVLQVEKPVYVVKPQDLNQKTEEPTQPDVAQKTRRKLPTEV